MLYNYQTVIRRIVDGDTLEVDIDLGFDMWIHKARVRLIGIDCPEVRTTDPIEKIFGQLATQYVEGLMPIGSSRVLRSFKYQRDSFARIVGDFNLPSSVSTLTESLRRAHHAVVWDPRNRELMAEEHLANRQKLIESGQVPADVIDHIQSLTD